MAACCVRRPINVLWTCCVQSLDGGLSFPVFFSLRKVLQSHDSKSNTYPETIGLAVSQFKMVSCLKFSNLKKKCVQKLSATLKEYEKSR